MLPTKEDTNVTMTILSSSVYTQHGQVLSTLKFVGTTLVLEFLCRKDFLGKNPEIFINVGKTDI